MRRVDEFRGVVQRRLLEDAVAQVHDMAVPVARTVENLFRALSDKFF
jgi:hypothetical protein